MKTQVFYDLIYSPDDGGWYGQAFTREGKDYFETDVHTSKEDAEQAIINKEPDAVLLKVID